MYYFMEKHKKVNKNRSTHTHENWEVANFNIGSGALSKADDDGEKKI